MKAPDGVVQEGVNFWDSASSVCLITYSHAAGLGLEGVKCVLHIQPAGHKVEQWKTALYSILIMDWVSNEYEIFAYGVESITDSLEVMSMWLLAELFPGLDPDKVVRPSGAVDVMIGLNYAGFHPVLSAAGYVKLHMCNSFWRIITLLCWSFYRPIVDSLSTSFWRNTSKYTNKLWFTEIFYFTASILKQL